MKLLLTSALFAMAESSFPALHLSDVFCRGYGWLPREHLDLKKYLTNRSPKRLQSLLASMAHAKHNAQWRTRCKVGPTPKLSTEYRLARIAQIDAKEKQNGGTTAEEMEERDRLFSSLPRRARRQFNRGRANL